MVLELVIRPLTLFVQAIGLGRHTARKPKRTPLSVCECGALVPSWTVEESLAPQRDAEDLLGLGHGALLRHS
jgi:hypothetical protein